MTAKQADRRPIIRLALNRTEVALAIGVSVSSIDQMVAEAVLPPPRKWHTRKLWLVSEIEAHLNEWPTEDESGPNPWDQVRAFSDKEPPADQQTHPAISEYYKRIGFDPHTMDNADLKRLHAEAEARWKVSIPGTPLTKRETDSLKQFAGCKAGTFKDGNKIKGCGPDTSDRLEARGYIEVRMKAPDRLDGYILTTSGEEAVQLLLQSS